MNYFASIYEGRYLAGIAAGLKTETNKLGYVAASVLQRLSADIQRSILEQKVESGCNNGYYVYKFME